MMEDTDLLQRLSGHSKFFNEANEDFNALISNVAEATNCENKIRFSVEKFEKPVKKVLSNLMYNMYYQLNSVVGETLNAMKDVEELKSFLIRSQESVIKLQRELLEAKANQLESVQTTVKSAVQDTVQAEIKLYSQAVLKASPNTTITEESLKKVVQKAVSEEDRSRNVLIFGLKETDEEKLSDKVDELFEQIEVKPNFEAVRIGRKSADKTRPVKILLSNSNTVHQILSKSKNLKLSEHHKTVFISPDRSPEEQARHHLLVLEMKEKAKKDLKRRYYIRSGIICCEDKIS
jgi:hypothetical protein